MPHVPLKVLRGVKDEEDIMDKYFDSFKAPGTTTEDAEDDDDDSRTSDDGETTDIGDVNEMHKNEYLRDHPSSIDSLNQFNNHIPELQNDHQAAFNNVSELPEYGTTGSFNPEASHIRIGVQVHHLTDSDETQNDSSSNDDTAPLLTNMPDGNAF